MNINYEENGVNMDVTFDEKKFVMLEVKRLKKELKKEKVQWKIDFLKRQLMKYEGGI